MGYKHKLWLPESYVCAHVSVHLLVVQEIISLRDQLPQVLLFLFGGGAPILVFRRTFETGTGRAVTTCREHIHNSKNSHLFQSRWLISSPSLSINESL